MGLLGKKLLKAAGVAAEDVPTGKEERERERREQMAMAWRWLRAHALDRAISEYFDQGSFARLEQYCSDPALSRLKTYLGEMREQGLTWIPSSREERERADITVVSHTTNNDGTVATFTVEEAFTDMSGIGVVDPSGRRGEYRAEEPQRRVLQALVICDGPQSYKLQELRQVSAGV